jgi:protein phosphatase
LAEALKMVVRTDPGLVRAHNEDAVYVDPTIGLVVLADGMGGYSAGEVASAMAVSHLATGLGYIATTAALRRTPEATDPAVVRQHILNEVGTANYAIFDAAHSEPAYAGMGTTLVLAWFHDSRMSVAHVGDSRLYRLRGGAFEQLTHDHSLLQEQLDAGLITAEQARCSDCRSFVTRALGVAPEVDVEIHDYDVRAGDIFLLCSDGLTDMLEDHVIAGVLSENSEIGEVAEELVRLANAAGGRDNISVILIQVSADFGAHGGWWRRLLGLGK